jgi:hypothetical protein
LKNSGENNVNKWESIIDNDEALLTSIGDNGYNNVFTTIVETKLKFDRVEGELKTINRCQRKFSVNYTAGLYV